jgi:DNA (cytosine-5)-methyltransferase 1
MLAFDTTQVTSPGNYSEPKPGDPCHPLAKGQHPPAVAFNTKESGNDASVELSPPLRAESSDPHMGGRAAAAYQCHGSDVGKFGTLRSGHGDVQSGVPFVADPITRSFAKHHGATGGKDCLPRNHLVSGMAVRRLTPRECERLQGFPDDYTKIPYRNKPAEECPDGPRYRALGNSMAVPVMRWLGGRIKAVGMEQPERSGA